MKQAIIATVFALAALTVGCGGVDLVDGDIGQSDQALESGQSCEEQCMEEFHACRESGGGGGPGNSGCAHDKNDCKDRC